MCKCKKYAQYDKKICNMLNIQNIKYIFESLK